MFKLGAADIAAIRLGTTEIVRAYRGTDLLFGEQGEEPANSRLWLPTDLPSVSLLGWYRTNVPEGQPAPLEITQVDGVDRVSRWADASGQNSHLTAPNMTSRPFYQAVSGAPQKVVRTDGSGSCFRMATGFSKTGRTGRVSCFTAAVFQGQFGGNARIVSLSSPNRQDFSANGQINVMQDGENLSLYMEDHRVPVAIPLDAAGIFASYSSNQFNYRSRFNGVLTPVEYASTRSILPMSLGIGTQSHAPGGYARAGLMEILLVMGNIISDADALRLDGYLAHNNGLAHVLPGDHPYKSVPPTVLL